MPVGGPAPPQTSHSFMGVLWQETGLDPRVIWAWANAEGAYAPGGTGHYNYLNLRAKSGGSSYSGVPLAGVSSAGFAEFYSPEDAAKETAYWINHMPNYKGIKQAADTGNPRAQLAAIAASPWDATHYGGGAHLYSIYDSVPSQAGGLAGFFTWLSKNWWVKQGQNNPLGAIGDFAGGVGDIVGGIGDAVSGVTSATEAAGRALSFLLVPEHWLRIGYIVGGGVLILGGIVLLARSVGAPLPGAMSLPGPQPQGNVNERPTTFQQRYGSERVGGEPKRQRTVGAGPSDTVPF